MQYGLEMDGIVGYDFMKTAGRYSSKDCNVSI